MPQRAIATDGVEWIAADMTFDQDGRDTDLLQRTIFNMGQGGVCLGGVVTDAGTRHIAISGPLHFTTNGELDEIASPSNMLLGASDTWYIVAKHLETDDTPATYYGAGSPPDKRHNMTPSIVARNAGGGGAAVVGNGEVDLATVVTNGTVVTLITDTRVIVPTVTNGSISLGAGKTIDGMDPSDHLTDVGDEDHAAHVFIPYTGLSAYNASITGFAAPYNIAVPYWWIELYHANQGNGFMPDTGDFPDIGETLATFRIPTMYGTFWKEGFGTKWKIRAILRFTALSASLKSAVILSVDDTARVVLNGVDIYTQTSADKTLNDIVTFTPADGDNTLELFFNNGVDEYVFQFLTDFLADTDVQFTPSVSP